MKNIIYLCMYVFISSIYSQEKKETIYILFDINNSEKCILEDGSGNSYKENKYRKIVQKNRITFFICEESFVLDRRGKIDTCDVKYLSKIKFETIQTMDSKRGTSKFVFKNSIFEKIYLIEKHKDKIIKYPVIWNTDLIEK